MLGKPFIKNLFRNNDGLAIGTEAIVIDLTDGYSSYAFLVMTYKTTTSKFNVLIPNYTGFNGEIYTNNIELFFHYSGDTTKMKVKCSKTIKIISIDGIRY